MSGARTEPAEVCGGNMKIISFIEQEEVIRRILVHCDLWNEPPVRPPPVQLSAEPVSPQTEDAGDYMPEYDVFEDGGQTE